jgi:hypothetical protein
MIEFVHDLTNKLERQLEEKKEFHLSRRKKTWDGNLREKEAQIGLL